MKAFIAKVFNKLQHIALEYRRSEVLNFIQNDPKVSLNGPIKINGVPLLDIREGCSLILGANVTLNSDNAGYHVNMHSPVKFFADKKGAQISIGDNTRIHGTCIHAYQSISIGNNCLIAANCHIIDGSGHNLSFDDTSNRINTTGNIKPVVIEDDVWICANCIILPGAHIGRGSVIAAGSVVSGTIPPLSIAAGNPAVVVKTPGAS